MICIYSHTIDYDLYLFIKPEVTLLVFFYSETHSPVHQLQSLEAQGLVLSTTPQSLSYSSFRYPQFYPGCVAIAGSGRT